MKVRNVLIVLALAICGILPAHAVDSSPVETQLRPLLQNKIIGLLVPYTAGDLKFDANSQLVGS